MLNSLPAFSRSIANGLASGLGCDILSFLALPLPFINELGSCIALLILLPLTFLEWPPVLAPALVSLSFLFGTDALFTLVFRLCVVEGAREETLLATGIALPKALALD